MKYSGRKALKPRNIYIIPPPSPDTHQLLLKKNHPTPQLHFSKENINIVQSIDASLAEELCAFKKKLERLRVDRERTEKFMEERDRALDLHMNHLLHRGDLQKTLEIQVDRLFRLKELHAYSSKISSIRTLREKEQEKKGKREEPKEEEEEEESSTGKED
ncbi:unnamed protein product [Cochlearia groenlandica]